MSDARPAAAEIVDAAADSRLLIIGSLPPGGRDLDLLAHRGALKHARVGLTAAGFTRVRQTHARFAACGVDVVELVPVERWRLCRDAVDELFADAQEVPPYRWLRRPAPHHALLVLARRLVLARGHLPAKLLDRADETLARDPGAWEQAERRASSWRLDRGLALLRAWHAGTEPSRAARVGALIEHIGRFPRRRAGGRRSGIIALSGLDGAGKSTQATSLAATLELLGHPTVVEWNPMSTVSMAVPRPLKNLLLRRMGAGVPADSGHASADRARTALRRQSAAVVHVLALGAAILAVVAYWRVMLRHAARGRLVIVDRYALDASVHLRFRYGQDHGLPVQLALIRWLSPRPRAAYLLEISPATAMTRKAYHWTPAEFELQARLYAEERSRHRSAVIDAERPLEAICPEIAVATWRRLG
jgi:thymidylate kinase